MKAFRWILLFLTLTGSVAGAESLWDENFSGYVSPSIRLSEGQIVTVIIDTSTKLSFSSTKAGDKEITMTFSGGETGDIFSFLPEISSGTTQSREGEEDVELSTQLAARVQEVNGSGQAYIQGSRNMQIQGAVEAITVTGWLQAEDLDPENRISFSNLAEGELIFRTFLDTDRQILSENDIVEALAELEAETAAAEEEAEGGTAAAEVPEAPVPAGPRYRLTDERKRELLLRYINNLIDLIFQ